jgi:hypothetical protein
VTDTIPRRTEPARLGGGWFHSTPLLDAEEIVREAEVFHKPARSTKGGRIYLTNKRLVYLPDRWAAIVGDDRVEWPLETIGEAGMTRESGIIFSVNNLLVFECMYVQRGGERHLFSTGLAMIDREWVNAIRAAMSPVAPAPAEPLQAPADATPGAAQPADEPPAEEPAAGPGASDG